MTDQEELRKAIAELPAGYITKRTINNKTYHYHQGTEDGVQFSFRIPEDELESLREQIEARKDLEKQLKTLERKTSKERKSIPVGQPTSSVMTGLPLRLFVEPAGKYQKRDCYGLIKKYVEGETEDRVCVVYGLRRTGKTTLLKQLIGEFDEERFQVTAYIKCKKSDTVASLNKDLSLLRDSGYRYIFIDEVTLMEDFIDSASLFSDVYAAQGLKIILTGTDSLGFHFAAKDELYDRAIMVRTTFIPFKEYSRLLGIDDIDEYIRYGGTLRAGTTNFDDPEATREDASFRNDETTRRYIDTAIASNIQHSLECYRDGRYFRQLRSLYEEDELTNAINRIIEDMNHSFTVSVITRLFKSHDLRSSAQMLRSAREEDKRTNILDTIDTTRIMGKLKEILKIKEKEEQKVGITPIHVKEIEEYLKPLGLVEDLTVETRFQDTPDLNAKENYAIFTQPGMRYALAEALVFSVLTDPQINTLPPEAMELIQNKILEDVKGRMLEDIVLLETKHAAEKRHGGKRRVFKLRFKDGEFDMFITDSTTKTSEAYEIKHSTEIVPQQYRHLLSQEMVELAETVFGPMTRRTVLYRGKTTNLGNGIQYKNIEEYLKEL